MLRWHRDDAIERDALAAIERLPGVTLEIDDARSSAGVRVAARQVAQLELVQGRVVVSGPADMVPALERVFPGSRPIANGVVFELGDARHHSEALAAIRRRVRVERLVWQFRVSSP
jgi:hypothetical protein